MFSGGIEMDNWAKMWQLAPNNVYIHKNYKKEREHFYRVHLRHPIKTYGRLAFPANFG